MPNTIITIGREFGSGGREIGRLLAEELGYEFYDHELVNIAAKESNLNPDLLRSVDEKATGSLLYTLVTGLSSSQYEMPVNDKLFIAQSDVIKRLAAKNNCVFVGRCADYVLENESHKLFTVFLHAPLDFKVERIMRLYNLTEQKAKERITKTEKSRRTYYNYYTNKDWSKMSSYDLCINTAKSGIEGAINMIKLLATTKGV